MEQECGGQSFQGVLSGRWSCRVFFNHFFFNHFLQSFFAIVFLKSNSKNSDRETTTNKHTKKQTNHKQKTTTHTNKSAVGLMADGAGTSAKRRRERRLRSTLRHERQTVAMGLAAARHHSRDGGCETNYGLQAPKTASSGGRPGVLTEPEPQGQERPLTFPRRSQVAPEPQPLLHLGVGEVHDGPPVSFLLQRALQERREEEERRMREEQEELNTLRAVPPERRTPQQFQRITDILKHRWAKRKKRRKRRTSRTSRSLRSRARRRQRQWHARFAGFAGDVPFHAVFPSVVAWPVMLGIMAGMDLKDSPRVWCAHR